jgi:transposase
MAIVIIGVDPHKASHTAVAISAAEEPLGELRVCACAAQAERLLAWAVAWPQRTWAVEGAGGLGHLLAQQLLAAGERVLDVPPELGARVRLLAAGDTNRTIPTMPGRWPSRRCGRPVSGRSGLMITRRC